MVKFVVGSFNFGVDQEMLQDLATTSCRQLRENFVHVCANMVLLGDLDILFGCGLGGSGQGFRCEFINAKDLLEESFGDISCAEVDNYIALCRFRQSLVVLYAPVVKFTTALDARRVDAAFTRFDIVRFDRGGASQPAVHSVAYRLW